MTTAFSTKSNQNIEDPLYRLLFSDEDEIKTEDKPSLKSTKQIEEEKPIIKKDKPIEKTINKIEEKPLTIKQTVDDVKKIEETKNTIQDEPKKETIEFNPIVIKPETDLDVNNKSSILEHLVYNLNKLKIPHTIKTFGYHTTDDFIITEYTVIDETSKNTILIVHLTKKQVRYQVPSHQKENKKLSKFAKDFQKQLKFTWLEWF